ncbi:MAG: amidohydrolase family protein [Dehalococcoidia bacterium]
MQSGRLLIRRAGLLGGAIRDIRISAGVIDAIEPVLLPTDGEQVIDAECNAVLRGLHDHHLHLFAAAAARASVVCGPPSVHDEDGLRDALSNGPAGHDGWIRGVGFHDSVCAALDRYWLDHVCPDRPVRVQHRSGMLWVLNSRALDLLGLTGTETLPKGVERTAGGQLTGRFYALDGWLGARLGLKRPTLVDLSSHLASVGVTGVTDAGARNGPREWDALELARQRGEFEQRMVVMGDETLVARTRESPDGPELGPLKIYLREDDLPALSDVVSRIVAAHGIGRCVAIHCVTRVELAIALAAFNESGTRRGDRIEHAAVTDDEAIERIGTLGLTVVTQPHFVAERGSQYLAQVEPADVALLYRARAFLRHGVRIAAGSDAPYGRADPWMSMRAAVSRRTDADRVIGVDEALSATEAMALYSGDAHDPGSPQPALRVGDAADLCMLDVHWEAALASLDARHVARTLCRGQVIYAAPARLQTTRVSSNSGECST